MTENPQGEKRSTDRRHVERRKNDIALDFERRRNHSRRSRQRRDLKDQP